jgi:hypothetical protein
MGAWRVLTACAALGLPTFGCANLPVTATPVAVPPSPGNIQSGGTQFDGVYQGAIQITATASMISPKMCQPVGGEHIVLRVANGSLDYTLAYANVAQTAQTFSVPIGPDGSFSGVGSLEATISGRVTGDQISATIVGAGYCSWAFSARRS